MVDILNIVVAFKGFDEFQDFVLFVFGEFFGGCGNVVEFGAFGFEVFRFEEFEHGPKVSELGVDDGFFFAAFNIFSAGIDEVELYFVDVDLGGIEFEDSFTFEHKAYGA